MCYQETGLHHSDNIGDAVKDPTTYCGGSGLWDPYGGKMMSILLLQLLTMSNPSLGHIILIEC
jgi:hypothetical protein